MSYPRNEIEIGYEGSGRKGSTVMGTVGGRHGVYVRTY